MIRAAVLVSGGGTNLQAIIDAKNAELLPSVQLALVLASRPNIGALDRALAANIPNLVCNPNACGSPEEYDELLLETLRKHSIEVVVLAGFMTILGPCVLNAYPGRILNVHPSLIPAFCGEGFYGLRVHKAVLASGTQTTGATVHLVNNVVDGGRILMQKEVPVMPGDTPETLQRRVMEQAEWQLLPAALERVCAQLAQTQEESLCK